MNLAFQKLLLGFWILSFAFFTGCVVVGESYQRPESRAGNPVSWNGRLDGVISDAELDPQILAEWWQTFNDEILNALMEQAVEANLDLRTAQAQLRRARAERNIAEAGFLPSVSIGGSAQRNTSPGDTSNLYSGSLDASWELDVFGGIQRGVEAAEADLEAARELTRDVLVSVLAEVALNYAELRTLEKRLAIAEENFKFQRQYLGIVELQRRAGETNQLEVERANSAVETTRAILPTIEQQIRQTKNRLAVLVGKNPGAIDKSVASKQSLLIPPLKIAVGVPAEVLRRRPDVRKAERELAAQTARVGVAKADLYPKFALVGSIGLESLSPGGLISSVGPRAKWTLFDGGRIREKIEVQSALQEQALVQYERAILTALEDVENAITALTHEQSRHSSLLASTKSAVLAAQMATSRYQSGDINFIDVLDAQRTRLSAEDALAVSEGTLNTNLIRLYKALGGGWKSEKFVRPND